MTNRDPYPETQRAPYALPEGVPTLQDDPVVTRWPVDWASENLDGAALPIGIHCSALAEIPARYALTTNANLLVIGATVRFAVVGRFGTPAALVLGQELCHSIEQQPALGHVCSAISQPRDKIADEQPARRDGEPGPALHAGIEPTNARHGDGRLSADRSARPAPDRGHRDQQLRARVEVVLSLN